MPLSAVTCRGQQSVSAGSTTASTGRRNWLSVLTFMRFALSVSTAACETALAVPAVVGTQTTGRIGPGTLLKLKDFAGSQPGVSSTLVDFARSVLLPPPSPARHCGLNFGAASMPGTASSIV